MNMKNLWNTFYIIQRLVKSKIFQIFDLKFFNINFLTFKIFQFKKKNPGLIWNAQKLHRFFNTLQKIFFWQLNTSNTERFGKGSQTTLILPIIDLGKIKVKICKIDWNKSFYTNTVVKLTLSWRIVQKIVSFIIFNVW